MMAFRNEMLRAIPLRVVQQTFVIFAVLIHGEFSAANENQADFAFFENKIRPVLSQHCYRCHSAEAARQGKLRGGLQLDTREGLRVGGDGGSAVVPGKVAESLLIDALQHKTLKMPPSGKLPDHVIADFVKWVEQGARDPRDGRVVADKYAFDREIALSRWAFQSPQKHQPPVVKDKNWPRDNLDHFVLARLESSALRPGADADRRMLLRRLSFDLIGLPPTRNQMMAFLADDSSRAVEKVVDELLNSRLFAERWARHWLDVVRYAETDAALENNYNWPYAWRYRDWVIKALEQDLPYDKFVAMQIAGDLPSATGDQPSVEGCIAAGFLALGPAEVDRLDELLATTGRAFWGMTLECAKCHDHKFDPISQREYFALGGALSSIRVGDKKRTLPLPGVKDVSEKEFDKYYADLRQLHQREFDAERVLLAVLEQEGATRQLAYLQDVPLSELIKKVQDRPQTLDPEFQRRLGDAHKKWQAAREALEKYQARKSPPAYPALRHGFGDGISPRLLVLAPKSGTKKAEPVPIAFPAAMTKGPQPKLGAKDSARRELAAWATSREHPLTARVFVNRVWLHLFGGRGLVPSPDNFGASGYPPTHPELLDRLAFDFMDSGWSTRQLIRRIVLSRTYQLSSESTQANEAIDPGNALYWRQNRRRLEAEVLRDSMLFASGRLNLESYNGSSILLRPDGGANRGGVEWTEHNHRSIYLPVVRDGMSSFFESFDLASPKLVSGLRESTSNPKQALFLLNSDFVMQQACFMANRVSADVVDDRAAAEAAFQLAYGRSPSRNEEQAALEFVRRISSEQWPDDSDRRKRAWGAFCHTLLASAEFRYVD